MYSLDAWHSAFADVIAAHERGKLDRMVRAILADAAICQPLVPKRGTSCTQCGSAPRHPFGEVAHPHAPDEALMRRIAAVYLSEDRALRATVVVRDAIEGKLFPITEPRSPAALTAPGRFLRGVQDIGAGLAAGLEDAKLGQRIKALLKPLVMSYEALTPERTKAERNAITDKVAKLLEENPALRASERGIIAMQLGEKFGVEVAPPGSNPNTARVKRLNRRRSRKKRAK